MEDIADLLFEARMLKGIPRSGYHFLGTGRETVAEHTFMTTFVALVMAKLEPAVDCQRLIQMCLIHDLPEARIGDLNTVQKRYVNADEKQALDDALSHLDFGPEMVDLIDEFNLGQTRESQLAHDADQLSFIIDLKAQSDMGRTLAAGWIPAIQNRLKTEVGRKLAAAVLNRSQDAWWRKKRLDSIGENK